jgi:hypothetical protein
MARVHSTTRLTTPTSSEALQRDEDALDTLEVGGEAPISKVMNFFYEVEVEGGRME